ncbi:MAG: SIS domain-containing protein [Acidimicrobiales bacterium]
MAEGYLTTFRRLIDRIDLDGVDRLVELLAQARAAGATVFIAGNGGSAATASHWANDLAKATKRDDLDPFRVMSLTDNASLLTALANDEGYDRVFAGQLENFAEEGDVLIVLSASGRSPNLVRAVELANRLGVMTVGLLGFDGGPLKDLLAEAVWLPTETGEYGITESAHSLVADLVTTCLVKGRPARVAVGEGGR